MNKNYLSGEWNEIKGKIRQKWGRLTDDDLNVVQGNYDELVGRIQKAYSLTKEKAWEEFETFKREFFNEDKKDDQKSA